MRKQKEMRIEKQKRFRKAAGIGSAVVLLAAAGFAIKDPALKAEDEEAVAAVVAEAADEVIAPEPVQEPEVRTEELVIESPVLDEVAAPEAEAEEKTEPTAEAEQGNAEEEPEKEAAEEEKTESAEEEEKTESAEEAESTEEANPEGSGRNVRIYYVYEGEPELGSEIKIYSELSGFEGSLSYKWEYSEDGGITWKQEARATSGSWTYILDEINSAYQWRLTVSEQ